MGGTWRSGSVFELPSEAKQGSPWLVLGWETCPTSRRLEGPGFVCPQGDNEGPTVCTQIRKVSTRTLGGVGKRAFQQSLHVLDVSPGCLPQKGAPHKNVHVIPVFYIRLLQSAWLLCGEEWCYCGWMDACPTGDEPVTGPPISQSRKAEGWR